MRSMSAGRRIVTRTIVVLFVKDTKGREIVHVHASQEERVKPPSGAGNSKRGEYEDGHHTL